MAAKNTEELESVSKKFQELHASLQQAEHRIKQSFEGTALGKERLAKMERSLSEVENAKTYAENNIGDNELMNSIIRDCNQKLVKLQREKSEIGQMQTKVIWSNIGFQGLISQIESINTIHISDAQPPELFNPICSGGEKGIHMKWPNHVAIDQTTGNIYACDIQSHKIQIFNRKAEYLRSFGHAFREPRAILIRRCKLYVIENRKSIHIKFLKFSIDKEEQLMSACDGICGIGKGQFAIASSFDIDPQDKWYITEPDNQRIQVLNPDFEHDSFFAASTTFSNPLQIRLRDSIALVLDNPQGEVKISPHNCKVCVFKLDGTWIRSVVLSGVVFSMYFAISNCNHIIVSDYSYGALKVFDFEGKLCNIGKRLTKPKGIEVFEDGTIVSLSMDTPCINIF